MVIFYILESCFFFIFLSVSFALGNTLRPSGFYCFVGVKWLTKSNWKYFHDSVITLWIYLNKCILKTIVDTDTSTSDGAICSFSEKWIMTKRESKEILWWMKYCHKFIRISSKKWWKIWRRPNILLQLNPDAESIYILWNTCLKKDFSVSVTWPVLICPRASVVGYLRLLYITFCSQSQ